MSEREPTLAELLAAIERLRTDLMARIDRMQESLTRIAGKPPAA